MAIQDGEITQLRIANCLSYGVLNNKTVQVTEVVDLCKEPEQGYQIGIGYYGSSERESQDQNGSFPYLSFIEITEELLIKFGLVKDDNFFCNDFIGGFLTEDGLSVGSDINGNPVIIKYAHRLQNYYNAISNQELTIKT